MLQRAASNAYSWWWASHIRTTQSKWLDANLQDVENRVKIMLKLLGEEADSFGKRAEMYYRRRPEVINHVEDVYRAYRALVERYDHLSKELHKANHTIATACPDEVQYAMLEEEDDNFPRAIMPINSSKIQKSTIEDILKRKREGTPGRLRGVQERSAPQMSKEKAEEEIGRLQKAILVMQTEKEFVKSSYESGVAKYWEIEKQIADMQEEICHMQDEFDAHAAIEDDEARALMTITALRSCQGMVAELVEKFEELIRSAKMESEKISSLREKFCALSSIIDPFKEVGSSSMTVNERIYPITREILQLQTMYDKIEDFFDNNSESSVEEMAYKVDELVDKIINLELKFPKQSAQIKQLKEENEIIKNKLDDLQDEVALLDDPRDSNEELRLVEDALNRSRVLEGSIIEEEVLVSTAFSEIFNCITNISKAFGPVGPEDAPGLSTAAGDSAICSEDVCVTKESTKMNGEIRDIEAPTAGDNMSSHMPRKDDDPEVVDHNSSGGTDDVYDSNNGAEENVPMGNCLVQEEFRDKKSTEAGNNIDLIVSSDNENGLNKTWESKSDSPSEQVDQSSSGATNKNGDIGNDDFAKFAQGLILEGECSPTVATQTRLLPSESFNTSNNKNDSNEEGLSVEVAESSFGGDNKNQDLKGDGDEYVPGNSLIQEEAFAVGYGELPKTSGDIGVVDYVNFPNLCEEGTTEKNSLLEADQSCSGDADKNLDPLHAGEAKSGEELPEQGDQIAPENIKGLNKHGKVESSEEGVRTSSGHTNAYPSEARDETSLCVPARDSEETGGYLQVSEVPTNSEDMANHISGSQLEKKNPNVEVLAREKSIFSNHGSRSGHDKSTLVSAEDVPSWPEFLLDGLEGRDAILLADYTSVLRNYKETKRRLAELEKKNQEHLEDTKAVIRELRNANSMKYVEIQSLKGLLDSSEMPPSKLGTYRSNRTFDRVISVVKETDSSGTGAPEEASPFEIKFRTEIDGLIDENLQLLARYSMACHQMQDFSRKYQELQNEMDSSENKKTQGEPDAVIEPGPAEKKLRELRTEVDVWFEQNTLLDRDLQLKTASLCSLQEEIAEALRSSTETDDTRFTPYEAARFQGEVQNMQQSNNKIGSELHAALERMRELESKVNETLRKLRESFELSSRRSSRLEADTSYQNQFKHFPSRTRVPLRNFLFGTKPKKKSLFACINPTYQRQFSDF